ncbi:unnamed protein product [Ceratitis capitata]|uniref:(Mediterranean fruit fly) hypothetical protein n=1 Tax=Ceratitis capitata TaxID=7213 RepID=A0A811VAQ9_CERCA|nr:unnamed protein product [Ceratitis capitata]
MAYSAVLGIQLFNEHEVAQSNAYSSFILYNNFLLFSAFQADRSGEIELLCYLKYLSILINLCYSLSHSLSVSPSLHKQREITITGFQTNFDRQFMDLSFAKHPNSKRFDMNVTLFRPIHENQFTLNVRLRVKPKGESNYRNFYSWKNVEGCSFLRRFQANKMYQRFFKLSPQLIELFRCPMKVGHYECKDLEVGQNRVIDFLYIGEYRVTTEVNINGTTKPSMLIINLIIE